MISIIAGVPKMPVWLQRTLSTTSSGDLMRTIRSDGALLREFLNFKRMLSRFKDCIKTGDGIRAKKSERLTDEEERRILALLV